MKSNQTKFEKSKTFPSVAIVLESASDLGLFDVGAKILEKLDISYQIFSISPLKAPLALSELALSAEESGFAVILASSASGGDLPILLSAHTILPVIGFGSENLSLCRSSNGAALSFTGDFGSDGVNAALMAASILALSDPNIKKRLLAFRAEQSESVMRERIIKRFDPKLVDL
ncbi:MAG TPA: 5-(carboxyamino)imidazole ribonucleotide mutase [Oligoflexia bacterium]|nr:5-(carboxyamino)imidazole ribonucleotide mutase [Oligoflexia bacterium]